MSRLLRYLVCALCLIGAPALAAEDPAFRMAARLGPGVNILGYDGLWSGAADAPFRMSDFARIRKAGFRHVRVNLFGFKYMDAGLRIDATMLDQLDRVIDGALAAGLVPVLDEHDYGDCQQDAGACATKLKAFWSQVSVRYAGRVPGAVFEILNEPGGAMTQEAWNGLLAEVLAAIRLTNPDRTVIVAAINSEDSGEVGRLVLPETDRNIIVTVHYYKPFRFTHQGAPWSPRTAGLRDVAWGSEAEQRDVSRDFDAVNAWAKAAARPIYLGEFGVYDAAPLAARARYAGFVSKAAEARGWPWAYWQFDHDFAIYDRVGDRWVQPILDAVMRPFPPLKPSL